MRFENQSELVQFLKDAAAYGEFATREFPQPIASVMVHRDGNAIVVILDCLSNYYSEWIKGEGADICLLRDQKTHKVVGARLPLYAKTLLIGGDGLPDITCRLEEHPTP